MRFRFIFYTLRPNQEKVKSKASFFLTKKSVPGPSTNPSTRATSRTTGKKAIPSTPVRFTNQNGYPDQIRYQLYGPLKAGTKLQATSDAPNGVKFEISPIVEGRATIKATYRGNTKIFLIN